MKQQNNSTRPLYVRVICWILIILLLMSAIYYTIWGLEALISSLIEDDGEKKSASLPIEEVTVLEFNDEALLL